MNYKHLLYFWAVAKHGGVVKAAEFLHVTPQTISGQIQLLEDHFGRELLHKSGRGLELTDAGQLAFSYAEDIFNLGAELDQVVRQPRGVSRPLELRVGIADAVPKMVASRLLEPALKGEHAFKVVGREWKLDSLLAELAVHRLDLVLSDTPLPSGLSVNAYSHRLGGSGGSFYAAPALAKILSKQPFPACLDGAPMLMPGADSAMGSRLTQWLSRQKLRPRIVGEFDDSALLNALGHDGYGVFLAPTVLHDEVCRQHEVKCIGEAPDLIEEFYVISVERRITHPGVVAITQAAREGLFAAWGQ
ncbi:MAG TPA: transcriptional activator NhaR [Aquabacterium sp.]|nr:transcriptional activator NhaR [Aquabacterium sp.]